ncbi:hypothetical protein POTOM_047213 [Populus tomentosa]|uniref:Uncharacterized protein n=1 Tax=Populus tomentosa TaxID=118781 RepID=A0A8X7YG48_POPTO|nr:hypothetical protein POTOM_047213 [Populus tomentosa]
MATAEVVSAQSALAEEKTEQPIKIETATEEAVAAAPEAVAEEPKEEVETPAASEEAVAPAPEAPAEVETKEVVEETKILAEEPPVVEKTEEETPKETPEPVVEETKEESPKEVPVEQVVEEAKEATESGETQAPAPEPEVAVEAPKEEEEEVKGEEKPVEAVEKVETETPVEKTENAWGLFGYVMDDLCQGMFLLVQVAHALLLCFSASPPLHLATPRREFDGGAGTQSMPGLVDARTGVSFQQEWVHNFFGWADLISLILIDDQGTLFFDGQTAHLPF